MPLKRAAGERELQSPQELEQAQAQAQAQARVGLPASEHDEGLAMEPGRPYQAFVENEARKYWQETMKIGSLTKLSQQEIRTVAMPILCQALCR